MNPYVRRPRVGRRLPHEESWSAWPLSSRVWNVRLVSAPWAFARVGTGSRLVRHPGLSGRRWTPVTLSRARDRLSKVYASFLGEREQSS